MQKRLFLTALGIFSVVPELYATTSAVPRIAVVYFSKTGNTASVAEVIHAMTGADLFRVETQEPYPDDYVTATEVVKAEIENGTVRPLKPLALDLSRYDTFILLTPTWWHHVAQPLQTWIRSVDLSGKMILTGNTHGGGGRMHTREDFEKLLAGRSLGSHLTVFGSVSPDDADVHQWLSENHLLH